MSPNDPKMEHQPLFCYETMLKLLYWSCLVYDHERVSLLPLMTFTAAWQMISTMAIRRMLDGVVKLVKF